MIYLLTGPVASGKSTSLLEWSKKQSSVAGIIQYSREGERYIFSIAAAEERKLTVDLSVDIREIIDVGKYKFSLDTLKWAGGEIEKSVVLNHRFVVIDEYGKLELERKGLEPHVSKAVEKLKSNEVTDLIIVIRDYLIEKAISSLQLIDFKLISKDKIWEL